MFSFIKKDKVVMPRSGAPTPKSSGLEKHRNDFPVLSNPTDAKLIYVDSACVSLRPKFVIDAISDYYNTYSACAGRSNHRLSRELDIKLGTARSDVANFVGAKHSDEIIFTRNATESINLVANSIVFEVGDIVLTSHKEHNSNLIPWLHLVQTKKITHNIIPPDSNNLFSLENLERALENAKKKDQKVKLVSVCQVSNMDGTAIDVEAVVKLAHKYGVRVLIDGCQAVGHIPVDVRHLGVDFYAFSAHKMCGPSGMGALYATRDAQESLSQFIVGGQTVIKSTYTSYVAQSGPAKFEAGLQDYSGILGFGAACNYLQKVGVDKIESHVVALNDYLTNLLRTQIINGEIKLLGPKDAHLRGGVFSFVVPSLSQTEFASMLDKTYGIAVRGGQHCVHSWFDANGIEGSVRVSLHFYNTATEIEIIADAIKSLLKLHGLNKSSVQDETVGDNK